MTKSTDTHRRGIVASAVLLCLSLTVLPRGAGAQRMASVTVVGLDYAYQAPDTLPAGLTAFAFENRGKVRHEVVIARLREGATLDSVAHSLPGPARLRLVENIGILVAEPGSRPLGRILVELMPGQTYVFYCNFQDTPDQPRHMTIGMVHSVQIK